MDQPLVNETTYSYTVRTVNEFGPGPDSAPVTVTPRVVLVFQDTNTDGVDDAWAVQNFGSVNFITDADDDGDGLSNSAEYGAGSDPKNSDSDGDGIPDGEDPVPSVAQPAQPSLTVVVPDEERLKRKEIEEKDFDYTRIRLEWKQWESPAHTTQFVIEQRISAGEWTPFATHGAGAREMNVSGLLAEQNYYFRITAVNTRNGRSATSSPATAVYQLPLFRAMSVSLSELTRSKPGFKEFAVDSEPPPAVPKYYLVWTKQFDSEKSVDYSMSDPDSSTSSGKTTSTMSASWAARLTPNEYAFRAGGQSSYSDSASWSGLKYGVSPWHSSNSESKSEESAWFEQARGKNNTTYRAEATESSLFRKGGVGEYAGLPRISGSGSVSEKRNGSYRLNEAFIAEPEKLRWLGYDFDLDQGRLEYSGSSRYDRDYKERNYFEVDGSSDNGAYSETSAADAQVDKTGRWTGTEIINSQWERNGENGSDSSQTALDAPPMRGISSSWLIDYRLYGAIRDVSPTAIYEHTDGSSSGPSSSESYSASLLTHLSEEFTTENFTALVEREMPDWPEPVYNFYGWGRYGWGLWGWNSYLTYQSSPYGWWLAQSRLDKTEESYRLHKSRFQLHSNPSPGVLVKWHVVFIPENDPETEEDESEKSKVVDSDTWQAPPEGGSSPLKTVDPSEWTHGNGNYYLAVPPRILGYDDSQGAGSVLLDRQEKTSVGTTMYATSRPTGDAQADGQTSTVYESSFWVAAFHAPGTKYKLTWQDAGITIVYSCYDADGKWVERVLRSGDTLTEEDLATSSRFRVQADPTQIQRLDFIIQVAATSRDGKSLGDDAIKTKILLPLEVNCPELYMFSGHAGDKVELCKVSGIVCEWKLKNATPVIGTFDHPTDTACSFTATTKGKNTIQLVMRGNVVWEKPTEVIEIVPRAVWGAVDSRAHTETMPDFQHVTLHHTSNANTGAAEMQRIQKLHMGLFPYNLPFSGGKNFDDIGYHFIMDKAGIVYEGRQLEVAPGAPGGPYTKGEHVNNNNTVAGIGFCTMGDYEGTEGNEAWPSARQKDLEKAVSALCRRYKLPASKLSYHKVMARAASQSLCPGSNYIPSIPEIIKHVTENLQ
jgi:hypothetical protein